MYTVLGGGELVKYVVKFIPIESKKKKIDNGFKKKKINLSNLKHEFIQHKHKIVDFQSYMTYSLREMLSSNMMIIQYFLKLKP